MEQKKWSAGAWKKQTAKGEVINFTINNNLDYGSNILEETFPDGQDIEVFKKEVLNQTWKQAKSFHELEHVTPFIRNNSTYLGQNKFTSE